MARFHGVYDKLKEALDGMPYDELGVSEELKEQVDFLILLSLMILSSLGLMMYFVFGFYSKALL